MDLAGYYPFSDIQTSSGLNSSIRTRKSVFGMIAGMNTPALRQVVASNVQRLMAESATVTKQVELAKKAKLSQSSVNRLLAGETDCLLVTALEVAKALGASIYELIEDPARRQAADLRYDRDRYAALTQSEKESIAAFIEFVMDNHDRQREEAASSKLNMHQPIAPSSSRKATVQRASDSRLSKDAFSTNDENHTTKPHRKANRGT